MQIYSFPPKAAGHMKPTCHVEVNCMSGEMTGRVLTSEMTVHFIGIPLLLATVTS